MGPFSKLLEVAAVDASVELARQERKRVDRENAEWWTSSKERISARTKQLRGKTG